MDNQGETERESRTRKNEESQSRNHIESDHEFNKKCESRSIINFPEKLSKNTPLLILHGTDDKRVLPHDSLDLSYQLLKQKNILIIWKVIPILPRYYNVQIFCNGKAF